MSDLLGPKGKQIPDHSLEMLDLPLASASDVLIVSNESNVFVEKTGDAFITSKISAGAESNRVWSAEFLTATIGDLETALAGILAPIPIPNWEALTSGIDGTIAAIASYNNELYVAGAFTSAGGVAAANIAKWDGSSWSALGSGLTGAGGATVRTLIVFNGELCVGGSFTSAGGVSVVHTAKWNGTSWSALGAGVNSDVMAFAIHNAELYVCGNFDQVNVTTSPISANRIARWTGSDWAALGSGISGECTAMVSFGGYLYVGGNAFMSAGGVAVKGIARWNGSWSAVPYGPYYASIKALAVHNNKLYMGGISLELAAVEGNTDFIGMWDGSAWHQLGGIGMNAAVSALLSFNGALFVGGSFTTASGVDANYIAVWDETNWTTIGEGMNNSVTAMGAHGGKLFVGGNFTLADNIAAQHIALRKG